MSVEVSERQGPRRLLVVSADMGGGHESTAAAIEQAAAELWPGLEVERLDTLDVMGPGIGSLFRRIYVGNVEHTPWLYEFFYAQLWRRRWFAAASKRFTGSWSGRRLAARIDRVDPDLIISTYPLGSSGLAWLRRHRGLRLPVAAYVSDIAPHPFWVYRELDLTFVVHESAIELGRACEPAAVLEVSALPARAEFRPGSRTDARTLHGLDPDAFVVLVSCGAYAFGDVVRTVTTLLSVDSRVQVVAACGRNTQTLERLRRLGLPPEQLRVLGWTGEMAALVRAADLVLSNAGGAIALETLASARPLLMYRPIAAHGQANADLIAMAGLADLCTDEDQLVAYIGAALRDRSPLRELESRALELASARSLRDGLDRLAGAADTPERPTVHAVRRDWRMRPSDAFFLHAETPVRRQDVGAILPLGEGGAEVTIEQLRARIGARVAGLPPLRRQLVRGTTPGWRMTTTADIESHIVQVDVEADLDSAIEQYYSLPLPKDGFPWAVALFRSPQEGRYVFAVKTHHALGDGISQLGLLDRLLDANPDDPLEERRHVPATETPATGTTSRALAAAGQAGRVASGLASLAVRSLGRWQLVACEEPSTRRVIATHTMPAERLYDLAAATQTRVHQVALTIVAHALATTLPRVGLADGGLPLRAMVPVATRPPRLDRVFGNWTAAVTVDLPLESMSFRQRLDRVCAQIERRAALGEPQAAHVAMQVLGHLPVGLNSYAARTVYTQRFFSTIVSYMPASRGERRLAGARVTAILPVVPLATGVPVTAGVVVAVGAASFGIQFDAALGAAGLTREGVVSALEGTIREAELEVIG